jgi:hypothetical protein
MSLLQRFIHAGPPHEGGPACDPVEYPRDRVHCYGCGKDGPRKWSAVCGECFHAWRWGWLLSLHDAWTFWRYIGLRLRERPEQYGWGADRAPWWRLDRLHTGIRIRRPGKIWVCPCCSHNL